MSANARFRITMVTALFSSRYINRPHSTITLPVIVITAIIQAEYRNTGFESKSLNDDTPSVFGLQRFTFGVMLNEENREIYKFLTLTSGSGISTHKNQKSADSNLTCRSKIDHR